LIRYLLTGAGLAAAIAASAGAADPPHVKLHGYLAANDIDGAAVIGPPPTMDSIRGRADRDTYLETRKFVGSRRWTQAIKDDDLWKGGAVERYSCALGEKLGPTTTPITYRILQRVELDVRTIGTPPKDHYNRTRPLIGNDLPVCVPREDWMKTNASYPSGHSMTGWAWALILGELEPGKLGQLMQAGDAIGESRIICGVHYRSDVEAGRKLGAAMVARLHSNPAFLNDLAAARAELERVHTAAPLNCAA
jgi:acid phosphatase (class A)